MDTITYLLIALLLLFPWLAIYITKKALRKKMLKTSILGGLAGFIAEYWYFKDYWRPPTLMGTSVISFEDFIFGFAITGISVTIYETTFSATFIKGRKKRKKLFRLLFLCGVAAMVVFNRLLGPNSIVISCSVFMLFTTFMIILRPDLIPMAFLSGLLMIAVVLPVYTLLFDLLNTDYWDDYWLLANTPLGITILGNIPVSELCWYFSWGSFAGIAHHFASGNVQLKNIHAIKEATLTKQAET